jgi:hypothetical protein
MSVWEEFDAEEARRAAASFQAQCDAADRKRAANQAIPKVCEEILASAGRLRVVKSAKPNGHDTAPDEDIAAAFTFVGDAPAAPPRELIKGLLPAYGVAVTGGQSTAGKTFNQIHKAICLATEKPYFNHKIVERVGTAFVAAEGRALIPNRFAAGLMRR